MANYALLDTGVNISIGKRAPNEYFSAALAQCETGTIIVGTITDTEYFWANLKTNCIPNDVSMSAEDYPVFFQKRRKMMAAKIRDYYYSL